MTQADIIKNNVSKKDEIIQNAVTHLIDVAMRYQSAHSSHISAHEYAKAALILESAETDLLQIIKAPLAGEDPTTYTYERRVVCAANRLLPSNTIILGVRHYDNLMRDQMYDIGTKEKVEQGFVDNKGVFLNREEAYLVAEAAGQIDSVRPKSGNKFVKELFSEDLH